MKLPTLHVIGLSHTRLTDEFSHCAYSGKIRRMSPMMKDLGYKTIAYVVEGSQSGADQDVIILTQEEQIKLMGSDPADPGQMYAFNNVQIQSPVNRRFNARLKEMLDKLVEPGDLVLHAFGNASQEAAMSHRGINVETGIGYEAIQSWAPWKIFESHAQLHRHCAQQNRNPSFYEWVIPNSYNTKDWTPVDMHGDYVLYMGRICEAKGLRTFSQMAEAMPYKHFIMCGQGDPAPYLKSPNIVAWNPIHGKHRDKLLGSALCLVCPSEYVEPFGGVAVEAMMTGTPVLSTPWGGFMETIVPNVTGYHCRVLNDWVTGVMEVRNLVRREISSYARHKFGTHRVAQQYDRAFRMIKGVMEAGGLDWTTFPAAL